LNELEKLIGCEVQKKLSPSQIREIRARYAMTQREWANFLGIPLTTIRNWEQEVSSPSRSSQVLLHLLAKRVPKGDVTA
jgi:DNA-binding transcriptional regulator YiaG